MASLKANKNTIRMNEYYTSIHLEISHNGKIKEKTVNAKRFLDYYNFYKFIIRGYLFGFYIKN